MMRDFKTLWLQLVKLYLLWILFFQLARLLFMLFQWENTEVLTLTEWFKVAAHGMIQDFSVSGYLLLVSTVLLLLNFYLPGRWQAGILCGISLLFLSIIVLIVTGDMELYTFWGFRLDATPLLFADHPKEMAASVSVGVIIRQLVIAAILWIIFYFPFRHYIYQPLKKMKRQGWIAIPGLLLTGGLLIIPIRGGFSVAPMNIGAVYFSDKPVANHAAVNVVFNLAYSLAHLNAHTNPYRFMDDQAARTLATGLVSEPRKEFPALLNNQRPNVLVILLESFTAKAVHSLGGVAGITPNLDSAAHHGILFSNLYSSGSRSDRGIVALISGYPALPTQGIMLFPTKTAGLPFISKTLGNLGYSSSFYYGGDIDFGGMRSYLKNGGFSKLVSQPDFGSASGTTKWGVFDQFVFDTLCKQLENTKSPFLDIFFTLSSHEPFIIPTPSLLPGDDIDSKFLSSIHYTDSCLGDFLYKAQKSAWWANTLVILVADHGSRFPGNDGPDDMKRYHIPMIWTGGAIRKDTVITTYASQADIPATLLAQMGLDDSGFSFSRNILTLNDSSDAVFFYNDGFGLVSHHYHFSWDNNKKEVISSTENISSDIILQGRAFQQILVNDFVSR